MLMFLEERCEINRQWNNLKKQSRKTLNNKNTDAVIFVITIKGKNKVDKRKNKKSVGIYQNSINVIEIKN